MTAMARVRTAAEVLGLAAGAPWRRAALEAVAALGLPDGWIGAGFLRAPVWDALHGHAKETPLDDIDVVYFDPACLDPAADARAEARLRALAPGLPWSVRNQARMHERHGDRPYRSTADALCHWLETPTAVALRLDRDGRPELLAPLGLDDLVGLVVRPTPHARARRMAAFRARVAGKGWFEKWPRLRLAWR
jgi:hypothetical protein